MRGQVPSKQVETGLRRRSSRKSPRLELRARLQARIGSVPVELEWDEAAAKWVTYVPLLNNISTFGDTQTEALQRTKEMMLDYIEAMAEDDLPLRLTSSELRSLKAALKRP